MTGKPQNLTISRAAEAAGVSVETIRFYERKGLIAQPGKTVGGGFRIYPETTVRRIRFIRRAQRLGFSLAEARDLLSLHENSDANCASVFDRTQAKLLDIRDRMDQLRRIETALLALSRACPESGSTRDCPIIETLNSNSEMKEDRNARLPEN